MHGWPSAAAMLPLHRSPAGGWASAVVAGLQSRRGRLHAARPLASCARVPPAWSSCGGCAALRCTSDCPQATRPADSALLPPSHHAPCSTLGRTATPLNSVSSAPGRSSNSASWFSRLLPASLSWCRRRCSLAGRWRWGEQRVAAPSEAARAACCGALAAAQRKLLLLWPLLAPG